MRQGRRNQLVAVLALGAGLAGLAWWVLAGSTKTDQANRSVEPSTSTSSRTTTSRPVTSPTTEPGSGVSSPTRLVGDGGPVLGQPVGLSLLVGGQGSDSLERFDLDTGVVTRYPGIGTPVAASDRFLVLLASASDGGFGQEGLLRAVPLDDLEAEGHDLGAAMGFYPWSTVAPGPDPGQIWVLGAGDTPGWRLVGIDDGAVLETVPATAQAGQIPGAGPDIDSSASGGLFERGPQGYRQVHPGRPLAVTEDSVLTVTCTQPAVCELSWLSRATWQPIDRAGPDDLILLVSFISPDGRYLGYFGSDGGPLRRQHIFDAERRETLNPAVTDSEVTSLAGSPDGRLLAVMSPSDLVLYNGDTGATIAIGGGSELGDAQMVFVSNG